MSKRYKKPSYDAIEEEKDDEVMVAEEPITEYDFSSEVKIQSRISARVQATGLISGKRYLWERAGAIVEVDCRDVPGLLEKKLGEKPCCGGNSDNLKVFEIVE